MSDILSVIGVIVATLILLDILGRVSNREKKYKKIMQEAKNPIPVRKERINDKRNSKGINIDTRR